MADGINIWQSVIGAREAIHNYPELADTPEDLGLGAITCAHCKTFEVKRRDGMHYCQSIREHVEFGTSACHRQATRERPLTFALSLNKLIFYKTRLSGLAVRLSEFRQWPLRMLSRHKAELRELSSALKERKRAIDEELSGIGRHPQWKRLRNVKEDALYIVECSGFVKIGYTSTPVWQRIQALRNSNPFDLTLIAIIPGDRKKEKRFHDAFKKWKHRGEWFCFDEEAKAYLVEMIGRHRGQVLNPPIVY